MDVSAFTPRVGHRNSGTDPGPVIHLSFAAEDMKQEALDALDHDAFAMAVRDVLEDEPEGLRGVKLYSALHHHTAPSMQYLHVQLAEVARSGEIVNDMEDKRYLHPMYGEKDE